MFYTVNDYCFTYLSACLTRILQLPDCISFRLSFLSRHSLAELSFRTCRLSIRDSHSAISWLYYLFPFVHFPGSAFHRRPTIFSLRELGEFFDLTTSENVPELISTKKRNSISETINGGVSMYFYYVPINMHMEYCEKGFPDIIIILAKRFIYVQYLCYTIFFICNKSTTRHISGKTERKR